MFQELWPKKIVEFAELWLCQRHVTFLIFSMMLRSYLNMGKSALGRVRRLDPVVLSLQGKWLYGCKGLLDITCFRRAAARLLARHEGLRAEMESPAGRGLGMVSGGYLLSTDTRFPRAPCHVLFTCHQITHWRRSHSSFWFFLPPLAVNCDTLPAEVWNSCASSVTRVLCMPCSGSTWSWPWWDGPSCLHWCGRGRTWSPGV